MIWLKISLGNRTWWHYTQYCRKPQKHPSEISEGVRKVFVCLFVCLFAFGSHHHLLPFIFGVWKGRSPFQLTGPSLSCLKDLSRDLLVNIFLSFPEKFSCLPFSPSWTFRQTNEQRKEKRKKKDSLKLTLPLLRKHWEPENSKSLKDWNQRTLFPFTVGDNYLSSILLGRE